MNGPTNIDHGRLPGFGVGPRILFWTGAWAAAMALAHVVWHPAAEVGGDLEQVLRWIGAGLILVGLVLWGVAYAALVRGWRRGELVTTGFYARARHPLYAVWIFLIVPGVVLVIGSWPVMTVPVAMWMAARRAIQREEARLVAEFGDDYARYVARTWPLFPRPW